ncbi:permease of the drug/metabolite transporter (DMT) superfamily [Clostridium cylindrosporum DSM 605]|uniref:Permease of the drug/metabolite transporter (DMT) superfamily n=2 Tax=Clostridium cylindrosporum TaxID=1495 RepID=A0A0J8D8F5_CLOCY|nr:permease of the drug/metabolite transporter (DMT) superfamily [Clostridium cylindrosporum DSM 605]
MTFIPQLIEVGVLVAVSYRINNYKEISLMNNSKVTMGHILAAITIVVWGTTFISTKVLLNSFSPIEILFLRFVIGYIALFIIKPGFLKFKSWKEEAYFAGAGLCGVTLYFLLENIALTYTFASNVGIIISIAPIFTALLAHVFLDGEKLRMRFFIGFAAAIIGIALVAFNGNYLLKLNPLGDILATLAALVWAFYSILMKKITSFNYNTIHYTRRTFFYGIIFIIPTLFFFDFNLGLKDFTYIPNILNIVYLGLGASAACFVIWNFVIGILGAVKTSVYIYMSPVITIVASAIILNENITWIAIIGSLLTLIGLYISEKKIYIKKFFKKCA